jgi:hypothetical protein
MVVKPKSLEIIKKNTGKTLATTLSIRTLPIKQLSRHASKITSKYVAITKEMFIVCVNELKSEPE